MADLRGLDKEEKCQKRTNTSEAWLKNDMLFGGGWAVLIFPLLIFFSNLSRYDIPCLAQLNTWKYCPVCAAQIHCQDNLFFPRTQTEGSAPLLPSYPLCVWNRVQWGIHRNPANTTGQSFLCHAVPTKCFWIQEAWVSDSFLNEPLRGGNPRSFHYQNCHYH